MSRTMASNNQLNTSAKCSGSPFFQSYGIADWLGAIIPKVHQKVKRNLPFAFPPNVAFASSSRAITER